MGERGIAEALIEQLKHGVSNGHSGLPRTEPCSDAQLGLADWRNHGLIERARHCGHVWARLSRSSQAVLVARYESRQWPAGVRSALGGLSGVVILQQAGRYAELRSQAAAAKMREALGRAESLRSQLRGSLTPELEAARQRVRQAASRLLEEPENPRKLAAVQRAADHLLETTWETPIGRRLRPLEAELRRLLLEAGAAACQAQQLILGCDMFPVFDACQKATQKDQEGKAARARVEAWKAPAAAAVLVAHDAWDLAERFITVFEQRERRVSP